MSDDAKGTGADADTIESRAPSAAGADPSPAQADPLLGKTIGDRYHVIEKIGRGGMGSVYRAQHKLLQRAVAIKVLHSNLTENTEFMERFRREALIGSMLSHHNAVTLYDFGVEDRAPYFVMQFVEGETLKSIIEREGALSLDRIVRIITQVCGALAEAHRLGIVHRDLKPDNIMLTKEGDGRERVSVLDFGIAKPTIGLNDVTPNLTRVDVVMGTPQYMSPEQAMNKEVGPASDIYSLGMILFEMLSGEMPYKGYSPVEILLKHARESAPALPIVRSEYGVPPRVTDVLRKCLEKRAENRYHSVSEFETALREAVPSGTGSSKLQHGSNPKLIPILCGASLLILVGVYSLLRPGAQLIKEEQRRQIAAKQSAEEEIEQPADRRPTIVPPTVPSHDEDAAVLIPPPQGTPAPEFTESPAAEVPAEPTAGPTAEPLAELKPETVTILTEPVPATNEVPAQAATAVPTEVAAAEAEDTLAAMHTPVLAVTTETLPRVKLPTVETPETAPAVSQTKEQIDELYRTAQKLFADKNYASAGVNFKKVLAARPEYYPARLSFGVCLLKLGLHEKALEAFQTALQHNPNYAPTYYNLASYYAYRGDVDAAVSNLEKAIKLFPKIRAWIKDDRDFDAVRGDQRFKRLSGEK